MYRNQPARNTEVRIALSSTIHKPQKIFVALQNLNRSTSQNHSSMLFDNMNVESCNVEINSVQFPDKDLSITLQLGKLWSYMTGFYKQVAIKVK